MAIPTSGPLKGSLTLTLHRGIKLHDTNTFGKQDPYCKVEMGKESFKTKVHENGGVNPVWENSFIFNIDAKDCAKDIFHLSVWDKETIADDSIGRSDLPIATLLAQTGKHLFQIVDKDNFKKINGSIEMTVVWNQTFPPVQQVHQQVHQATPVVNQQSQMMQQQQQAMAQQQAQMRQQQAQQQALMNQQQAQMRAQQIAHQQQMQRAALANQGSGPSQPVHNINPIAPFIMGRGVFLNSASSHKNLRVMMNGQVNSLGGTGKLARFHVRKGDAPNEIRLQSQSTGKYLRITNTSAVDGIGGTGKWTSFIVKKSVNGMVCLQSGAMVRMGTAGGVQHIGAMGDGSTKHPSQTGAGINGQFKVSFF